MDQPPNVAKQVATPGKTVQCANAACAQPFVVKKFNQLYCSAKCRWAGWLERQIKSANESAKTKAKGTT